MSEKTLLKMDLLANESSWIVNYQNLSEKFISDNLNQIQETNLSYHQKLSEKFIRENQEYFKYELSWRYLLYHQELSKKFIDEFKHKTGEYI